MFRARDAPLHPSTNKIISYRERESVNRECVQFLSIIRVQFSVCVCECVSVWVCVCDVCGWVEYLRVVELIIKKERESWEGKIMSGQQRLSVLWSVTEFSFAELHFLSEWHFVWQTRTVGEKEWRGEKEQNGPICRFVQRCACLV